CKDCRRDYYNENKDRINARRRAWRKRVKNYWKQTDPEKLRRNTMRYYYRLREKLFNHLSDGTPKFSDKYACESLVPFYLFGGYEDGCVVVDRVL
ncbi:unnamed protein product, partial [marine sediment metagenome]